MNRKKRSIKMAPCFALFHFLLFRVLFFQFLFNIGFFFTWNWRARWNREFEQNVYGMFWLWVPHWRFIYLRILPLYSNCAASFNICLFVENHIHFGIFHDLNRLHLVNNFEWNPNSKFKWHCTDTDNKRRFDFIIDADLLSVFGYC